MVPHLCGASPFTAPVPHRSVAGIVAPVVGIWHRVSVNFVFTVGKSEKNPSNSVDSAKVSAFHGGKSQRRREVSTTQVAVEPATLQLIRTASRLFDARKRKTRPMLWRRKKLWSRLTVPKTGNQRETTSATPRCPGDIFGNFCWVPACK